MTAVMGSRPSKVLLDSPTERTGDARDAAAFYGQAINEQQTKQLIAHGESLLQRAHQLTVQ